MTNKKRLISAVLLGLAAGCFGSHMTAYAAEEKDGIDTYTIGDFVVTGERYGEELPGGFMKESSQVGLLGEKDAMEVPFQAISLTQKTIDVFGANPSEASTAILVNAPAIRTAGSTIYNDFSLRGQTANAYQFRINGIPGLLSQTNIPMNFFESVDVISGASVGISGVAAKESAGGTVNLQTKRAHQNMTQYSLGIAERGTWSNNLDIARRFGRDGEHGLRINGSYTTGATGIIDERVRNKTLAINYDHHSAASSTNLLFGFRDTWTEEAQRYFYLGNAAVTSMPAAPDADRNFAFKGQHLGMKTYLGTLNHEQKIGKNTRVFLMAGASYNDGYGYLVPSSSRLDILNNNGDYSREMVHEPFSIRNSYLSLGLSHNWTMGEVKNKTIFAVDKDWYQARWGQSGTPKGTITGNLYTGHSTFDFLTAIRASSVTGGRTEYYGYSLLNESTVGKAIVTLGLHHHISKAIPASGNATKTSATAPIFGFVYRPTRELSLFANHSESFHEGSVVKSGYLNAGAILQPGKTKSNEIGLKYTNGNFLAALSYFDMTKADTFDKVVGGGTLRTMDGELSYKGLEFSMGGEFCPKWSIFGGFLCLDSEYTKRTNAFYNGKTVEGTPNFSFVSTLQYAPDKDSAIFLRVVHTGDAPIYTTAKNTLTVPSSTVFDLGARYRTKIDKVPVTFTATVFNVFNRSYWLPRATYSYGILGNPRTFALSMTMDL